MLIEIVVQADDGARVVHQLRVERYGPGVYGEGWTPPRATTASGKYGADDALTTRVGVDPTVRDLTVVPSLDVSPPAFLTTYPKAAQTGATSLEMVVQLDEPGVVFYLIIKNAVARDSAYTPREVKEAAALVPSYAKAGNITDQMLVTRETVAAQRRMAAGLLLVELDALRTDLSMKQCTAPVTQLAEESGAPSLEKLDAPYKAILDGLVGRLRATVAWADNELSSDNALKDFPKESRNSLASRFGRVAKADGVKGKAPLFDESELLEPLQAMHASLCATGFEDWAEGRLVDTIHRPSASSQSVEATSVCNKAFS